MYFLHDNETGQRESLETRSKARANELLVAKNEAAREPAFNLQKARVYLAAADPGYTDLAVCSGCHDPKQARRRKQPSSGNKRLTNDRRIRWVLCQGF